MAQMGIGMRMNKDMAMNMDMNMNMNNMNIPTIAPMLHLPPFMPMAPCGDRLLAEPEKVLPLLHTYKLIMGFG